MILRKKKIIPKRKYHDGDVIEFNFEPNSIDVYWYDIILIGVISGVLYENEDILYTVQLRDNKRKIFGDVIVPEKHINGIIEDSTITVKCNFCGRLVRVDKISEDKNKEWEKWKKLYCLGNNHHILNICIACIENTKTEREQETLKCPHDHCTIISEQKKEFFEKNGIKLVDQI